MQLAPPQRSTSPVWASFMASLRGLFSGSSNNDSLDALKFTAPKEKAAKQQMQTTAAPAPAPAPAVASPQATAK